MNEDVTRKAKNNIQEKIAKKIYTNEDITNINNRKIQFGPRGESSLSDLDMNQLDCIRTLCRLYDNEIRISEFLSNRRFIGPIIVLAKKVLVKITKILMKEYVTQNRDFQAANIKLLIELINSNNRKNITN